jgi:hypothetical protein
VGKLTLPVYEIYKVGEKPHWIEGLDILGRFGLELVVIPHWNNAEGGTHDTRFCYMGRPRFSQLEDLLPEDFGIIGLDEHTACILDLEKQTASVEGVGSVTLKFGISELIFESGSDFPFSVLKGEIGYSGKAPIGDRGDEGTKSSDSSNSFWDFVHQLEDTFKDSLQKHKGNQTLNSILELDQSIWNAYEASENPEQISQAREVMRELLVLLGAYIESLPKSKKDCLAPLVNSLLELREKLRQQGQWSLADAVRDSLAEADITVDDTIEGADWKIRE